MLIFPLASVAVEFKQFCDFSLNKSCKTYLGTMLPPGGRNWKLISLTVAQNRKNFHIKLSMQVVQYLTGENLKSVWAKFSTLG